MRQYQRDAKRVDLIDFAKPELELWKEYLKRGWQSLHEELANDPEAEAKYSKDWLELHFSERYAYGMPLRRIDHPWPPKPASTPKPTKEDRKAARQAKPATDTIHGIPINGRPND